MLKFTIHERTNPNCRKVLKMHLKKNIFTLVFFLAVLGVQNFTVFTGFFTEIVRLALIRKKHQLNINIGIQRHVNER